MIRGDASEVYRLANSLAGVGPRAIPAMRGSMLAVGEAFAKEWADNARETSGEHGKHYPNSIDAELVFSVRTIDARGRPELGEEAGADGSRLRVRLARTSRLTWTVYARWTRSRPEPSALARRLVTSFVTAPRTRCMPQAG